MIKTEFIQRYLYNETITKLPKIMLTLEDIDMKIIFNTNPLEKIFSYPEYIVILDNCEEDSISNIKDIIKKDEKELQEAYNRYYEIIEDILEDENREYDFETMIRELNKYSFNYNKDYIISIQLKPKLGIMKFKETEDFKQVLKFMQRYGDFKEPSIIVDNILLRYDTLIEVKYKDFSAVYNLFTSKIEYKFAFIDIKDYVLIPKYNPSYLSEKY